MILDGKVAIITGSGRGIGRTIAQAFSREGAKIVVAARTKAEVETTSNLIKSVGCEAIPIKVDVGNYDEVIQMVDLTVKYFGKIDILVNNAGIQGPLGRIVDNDIREWEDTLHTNIVGTFYCARAVLPFMMKQKSGKIINLSGGGSTSSRPYFTAYAASKTAVVRFTESLSDEVKTYNIQVNAIAPGAVNTTMVKQVLEKGIAVGEKELVAARKQIESGGTSPEKGASLAVFLASEKSNGLTGKLISAVWDDWNNFTTDNINNIMSSDIFTLRRIIK